MQISVNWLMDNAKFEDAVYHNGDVDSMWNEKFEELTDKFIDSVQTHGIQASIDFDPNTCSIGNGHHRLLIAWLLNIEFIEVNNSHYDEYGPKGSYAMQMEGWPTCYE